MARITVEVVYARPDRQALVEVSLEEGATLEAAIGASGIAARFPHDDLSKCRVGVWGRITERDALLEDGDRVEIYRPLVRDPRDARRERAKERD